MSGPVLVTGASGFVGSHLLDLLERRGASVVAWRHPAGKPARSLEGVSWMDVDLLNRADVTARIGEIKPSSVYHLAGAPHVAESWKYTRETYEANVLTTHYLYEALRVHNLAPRILIACSAHVYAPQPRPLRENDELKPASPYATSKLAAEMLSERAWQDDGLPTLIARSFNHVGPGQDPSFVAPSIARQIALIENGRLEPVLTLGDLEPKRDLTDVRDTVQAYVAMAERARPGEPYNVCSGRAVAVGDLVEMLTSRSTRSIRVVQDPALLRPNDVPLLVGDHSKLTADTGWEPHVPLEKTMDDLLDYWRTRVVSEP